MSSLSLPSDYKKYVKGVDETGPVTVWICEFCEGRVMPMNFAYHIEKEHAEAVRK